MSTVVTTAVVATAAVGDHSNNNDLQSLDKNFPSRLFRFLSTVVEANNISHIASWQPHGRCFRIHNPNDFINLTEPSWFVYKKYSSFQRQLNIYGFVRITDGIDKQCYYHEHFLRDHPYLLYKIIRIPTKKDAPPSLLTQAPYFDTTTTTSTTRNVGSSSDSSAGVTPKTLSALNNSNIQYHNGSDNHLESLTVGNMASIELLQDINRRIANQTNQTVHDAAFANRMFQRTNRHPTTTSTANYDLLLHMMAQNAASLPMASDVSATTLSQNGRDSLTERLYERQIFLSQLQREELNHRTNSALVTAGMTQSDPIRALLLLPSQPATLLPDLVSQILLQNEPRHQTSQFALESLSRLLPSNASSLVPHFSYTIAIANQRNTILQNLLLRQRNEELQQHIALHSPDVLLLSPNIQNISSSGDNNSDLGGLS